MFTCEAMSVHGLFSGSFYAAPAYQREYVWQPVNVRQLLWDIGTFATSSDRGKDDTYYMGSVVTVKRGVNEYDIVDGQQRLTTLFLILCVARNRVLRSGNKAEIQKLSKLNTLIADDDEAVGGLPRPRLSLEYHFSETSKLIRSLVDERPAEVLEDEDDIVIDQPMPRVASGVSIDHIEAAVRTIERFFAFEVKSAFNLDAKAYLKILLDQTLIVRISTESLRTALVVFETTNNRGVGIDASDLAKNLIFMRAKDEDYGALGQHWRTMRARLKEVDESPEEFLRTVVRADYADDNDEVGGGVQVYEWIRDNPHRTRVDRNAAAFAQRLVAAADAYANIRNGRCPRGEPCPASARLAQLAGANRSYMIPLMAARHLKDEQYLWLAQALEDAFFVLQVGGLRAPAMEELFAAWARRLRKIRDAATLHAFIKETIGEEKAKRAPAFLRQVKAVDARKNARRARYVLTRLAEHIQRQEGGAPLPGLWDPRQYEVEHVFPRRPSPAALAESGMVPLAQVERLGNLALVTKGRGVAAKAAAFTEKRPVYAESPVAVTRALAGSSEPWTAQSIEARTEALTGLVGAVWGVE